MIRIITTHSSVCITQFFFLSVPVVKSLILLYTYFHFRFHLRILFSTISSTFSSVPLYYHFCQANVILESSEGLLVIIELFFYSSFLLVGDGFTLLYYSIYVIGSLNFFSNSLFIYSLIVLTLGALVAYKRAI
jgi:hypothetical protein